MIRVNICGRTYQLGELMKDMIFAQFRNRKNAGAPFWYSVSIETDGVTLSFCSRHFPDRGYASSRRLTRREERILDYWKHVDAADDSDPHRLVKFLDRLSNAV